MRRPVLILAASLAALFGVAPATSAAEEPVRDDRARRPGGRPTP